MNKVGAKSPDNEKNWKAIDIFLFSNGQQYSPPRKYHLQAEDLNWWISTLNNLARSHYGSLHTIIELYTLDGRKIKGPLELRDGTAYVAVVPPDAFIDSGYERYLIKASMSWDKRQAKRTSIVDKPDERTDCGHFRPCCPCPKKALGSQANATILGQKVASVLDHFLSQESDIPSGAPSKNIPLRECGQCICVCTAELTTIKMPDENIAVESAMVRPQKSSTPKLDKSETQPPLKSIIAPPKLTNSRNEKGRLSGPHTAFVKPVTSSNTQPRKLSAAKTKEGFHKKMLTKIPITIKENANGLAVKPKRLMKTPQHSSTPLQPEPSDPPPTPQTPPPSSPPVTSLPPPTTPPVTSLPPPTTPPVTSLPPLTTDVVQRTVSILNQTLPTDVTSTENLISNKEIIVISADMYKSVERETRSFHKDSNRGSVIDELISCYTIHDTVEEGVQAHIVQATEKVNTVDAGVSYSDGKIKVIPVTFTPDSNVISCNIPLEDNYIAVINKGDAVNLNLSIDVQNSKTAQLNSYSNLNHRQPRKVSSLMNVLKKEKPQSTKDEETTVQNTSLQSIVSCVNDCFAKVVVVQCACCGNNTTIPRIDTMPVYKDENGFFVLMPGPPPENPSCACGPNRGSITFDKKIMSELYLPDLTKTKSQTEFPVLTRDAGVVMTVMNCGLPRFEDWQNNVYDTYMMTKRQVSINENQCNVASCWPSPSQVIERTEVVISRSEQQRQPPCSVCACSVDAHTQTEWCRVLLQVKSHDDGHYTFHLPPLEMLKFYSIQ